MNWTATDAKARFAELMDAAQGTPQRVTRRGRPAVVVVSSEAYDELARVAERGRAARDEGLRPFLEATRALKERAGGDLSLELPPRELATGPRALGAD